MLGLGQGESACRGWEGSKVDEAEGVRAADLFPSNAGTIF